MSNSIFGDDEEDDFQLTAGADNNKADPKNQKSTPKPAVQRPTQNSSLPPKRTVPPVAPQPTKVTPPPSSSLPKRQAPAVQKPLPSRPTPAPIISDFESELEEEIPLHDAAKAGAEPLDSQNKPQFATPPATESASHVAPRVAQPIDENAFSPRPHTQSSQTNNYASRQEEPASLRPDYESEDRFRSQNETYQQPSQAQPTGRRRETTNAPSYENDYSDSYRQEPVEAPAKKKGFFSPAPKKTKAVKAQKIRKQGNFSGGRKGVLIIRIIAVTVILVLMGLGVKSILLPPSFPSPATVISTVRQNLGVTKFPTDAGKAFVSSFASAYFTIDPETAPKRLDTLRAFTTDILASTFNTSDSASTQKVTAAPIVTKITSVDDNNAEYTVSLQLNGTRWVYVTIPVYYDSAKNAFAISDTPAFVSAPNLATLPNKEAPFQVDAQLGSQVTDNLKSFFAAWGESDSQTLSRYIMNNANVETQTGLRGAVKFVSVQNILVEQKEAGSADMNQRRATVQVTWADPTNPKIIYNQNYNMKLFQQPDQRWYVQDISAGAPISGTTNSSP